MSGGNWSSSESTVLAHAQTCLSSDREAVLATIVDVEGSAYRRPGAKMLISGDGDSVGRISAGCLEDEVFDLASDVLAAGTPRLETFDLMEDDIWGLGIGCNGVITILLEPLSARHTSLIQAHETREPALVASILQSDSDDVTSWRQADYTPEQGMSPVDEKNPLPEWLLSSIERQAAKLFGTRKADTIDLRRPDGEVSVFLDGIAPPPRLVVVGTNHDVKPVVELANNADLHTTVVGYRGATATTERFPNADDVYSTSPAQISDAIDIDDRTYFAVMTHNFIDDRITVGQLADSPTQYIGLMGPRERFEQMLDAYDADSKPTPSNLRKVYTPIGLNLGGGAPYQIALSIVSEVLAVHNNRDPKHLHQREGPIHDRLELDTTNNQ